MNQRGHIDLFSGIGGFSLAAHWAGFTTEVFCEQDAFCQQVLSRHWPAVPIVSDIRDFDGRAYTGADLLTGGFPCQPFSCAGQQRGNEDDRALWPEMLRVIREARPSWIVGENVAGIINMALDGVLSDLENEGYATQAFVIPACAVNAPHKRDRVWMVAHTSRTRTGLEAYRSGRQGGESADSLESAILPQGDWTIGAEGINTSFEDVAHTIRPRLEEREKQHARHQLQATERSGDTHRVRQHQPGLGQRHDGLPKRLAGYWDGDWERGIPRIAAGIPQRTAKLKALGNSIVPQVAYEILRHLGEAA